MIGVNPACRRVERDEGKDWDEFREMAVFKDDTMSSPAQHNAASIQPRTLPRTSPADAKPTQAITAGAGHAAAGGAGGGDLGASHRRSDLFQRVDKIISAIRPAVQDDGGDLELVDVTEDGVVMIRLHGACVSCPSSGMTLHGGVERSVRERVPEITRVQRVH